MEHKYGLLGEENTIVPKTGTITGAVFSPARIGKGRTEPLLAAIVEEAA